MEKYEKCNYEIYMFWDRLLRFSDSHIAPALFLFPVLVAIATAIGWVLTGTDIGFWLGLLVFSVVSAAGLIAIVVLEAITDSREREFREELDSCRPTSDVRAKQNYSNRR